MSHCLKIWTEFFSIRRNVYLFFGNLLFVVATLHLFTRYLVYNETREGTVVLNDPLFSYFNAIELDTIAFALIYIPLITFIIYGSFRPRVLAFAMTTYGLLVWFRMFAMFVTPLEVPAGMIDLKDPIVFVLGTGQAIQRDLFFSGHTSTLTILTLIAFAVHRISSTKIELKADKYVKYFFMFSLVIVASCVVLQKAHYTIDVFAAPFFAFGAYSVAKKMYGVK